MREIVASETYLIDGENVDVRFSYKTGRRWLRMYARTGEDGKAYLDVRAPYAMARSRVQEFVAKNASDLLRRAEKARKKKHERELPFGADYVYVLGKKTPTAPMDEETRRKWLKKEATAYLSQRVRFWEKEMGCPHAHRIRIRFMKTLYGSNSPKGSISLEATLYHYAPSIIDSVVVHECAHDFCRNHQKGFYDIVLRYCPNYWECRKILREKEYANDAPANH